MTIQEPAWLKRTRPCPFFSRGRCLFADSCNFLHDAKVRSAVIQQSLSTIVQVKQPSLPLKHVFDPPTVVINSASPRLVNLSSPEGPAGSVQDSSRYLGLLSVLSDVIGPPSDLPMEQGTSSRAELSSIPEPNSEDASVNLFDYKMESSFPGVDGELVAEFPSVPAHEEIADGKNTYYFTESMRTCIMGSVAEEQGDGGDDDDVDDHREEDPIVMASNRQSTLSSFTGASLLASPRKSIFGEPSVGIPVEDGVVDLLSPVQLSVKLQPFPLPSLSSKVGRRDSIDSGYADADSWVSPIPFPRSPPRSFHSPVTFPSHSRRVSHSTPSFQERGASSKVGVLRQSTQYPIEIIKEIKNDENSEDLDNIAYAILGAYDTSHSEEQREDEDCDPLQASVSIVAGEAGEDDDPPVVPTVVRSLQQRAPERLHPTREHDPDSCSRLSFVSDDNVSFKNALSTQPSYDGSSDTFIVSPVEHDSVLSSVSGCLTSSTSVHLHYGDAKELLEQPIVSSHVCKSSLLAGTTGTAIQIHGTKTSKTRAPEDCSHLEIDSSIPFDFASADILQGLVPEVIASQVPLPGAYQFDRCSLIPSPSVDTSRSLPSAKDVLADVPFATGDLQEFVPERVANPQERLSGAFHFDKCPSRSGLSAGPRSVRDVFGFAPPGADVYQEFVPQNAVAPQERFLSVLHHGWRSSRSSPSTGSSYNLSSCTDIRFRAAAGADDVREIDLEDVIALQERLSGVSHFNRHFAKHSSLGEISRSPSPIKDIHSYGAPGAGDAQENLPVNTIVPQERLSGVSRFNEPSPQSSSSAKSSYSSPSVTDLLEYALPGADGDDFRSLEPSSTVLQGSLAECGTAKAGRILATENSPESDEIAGSFGLEDDESIQRLSFPLPPPFLPVEFVGHSDLSGDTPILPETASINLGKDMSNTCSVWQHKEVQRLPSGSELTKKARPSRVPSARSPDFDTKITLQRSRAASDLTVKGRPPSETTPGYTPCELGSSLPSLVHQDLSEYVQSFYDQYFDGGVSDDDSELCSPTRKGTAPPDVSSPVEAAPQDVYCQLVDPISHVFHKGSFPFSDSKTISPDTDSPRSETVLRPLSTGGRLSLHSSFAELIPKANTANAKETSSPTLSSNRSRVREIGSTMVPLGFRRRKPLPVATQSLRGTSEPVHPLTRLREVLRIRTDITEKDSPPSCSSAIHASSTPSPLSAKPMSAPATSGLRQLRLSSIINRRSSTLSTHSSSTASSILSIHHIFSSSTPQSPSVSSTTSFSHNSLFSSSCERIPEQLHHTPGHSSCDSLVQKDADEACSVSHFSTCRDSRSVSAPIQQPKPWRLSCYRAGSRNYTPVDGTHRLSRRTSTLSLSCVVDGELEIDEHGSTVLRPIQLEHTDGLARPASVLAAPVHAIATPKPTLLFAIASDNVDQVRQVLESGEAGPSDSVGPQSALAFTLTNDKLARKQEIVKALLAYGANPSSLRNPTSNPAQCRGEGDELRAPPPETTLEGMDPATRYFVARADAAHTRQTSQLLYRSYFRPLTRVQYDVIGQDWALEQLFRVLSMHPQKLSVAPIAVLLCGPSGHGKSLLARKFGFLLDVPTHTVNMTTLRSTHDIWQSYSMSPYEEPSLCTLAEFLTENEGKRCVVVLDEIEKVEDQKALWSLLMPWELGRCSLEAGKRHVDARNVIWLGTSNVGHELVFQHHENRAEPDKRMSREEYLELTDTLRPRVSHCLGASLVSRITAVLPFVPFTLDEKKAIAAEAVYALSGDSCKILSPQDVESLVMKVLPSYHPSEGARSLHRAIANILADAMQRTA